MDFSAQNYEERKANIEKTQAVQVHAAAVIR